MMGKNGFGRRDRGPVIGPAAHKGGPYGWSRRRMVTVLGGGAVVIGLLIATITHTPMGGLFARLLTGKGSPREARLLSQGNTPLAIVRLTVEGMTCYR